MTAGLDRIVANPVQAVSAQAVNKAARDLKKDGVTSEEVRSFIDTLSQASDAGRMDAAARAAYRKQLVKLLEEVPEGGQTAVTVRLSAEGLQQTLGKLQAQIASYRKKIGKLEAELEQVNRDISAKSARASELNRKREELLRKIQAANEKKRRVRNTGLLALAFGIPVPPAAVLVMGMSINDAQREASSLSKQVSEVQAQQRQLENLVAKHKQNQAALRGDVDALRKVERKLSAAIAANDETAGDTPDERVDALAREVSLSRTMAKNLKEQIAILKQMVRQGRDFGNALSNLVSELQADVTKLEERAEQAERELQGAIIDVLFAVTGTDPKIRIGDFSFSKKLLLLDGVGYMRVAFDEQLNQLVDRLIVEGLVDATGSRALAKAILAAVRGGDGTATLNREVRGELEAAALAELTDAQRFAIDVISRRGRGAGPSELVQLVLRNSELTDTQARAVALILDGSGASAAKKAATREVLEDGVDAAMVVMRHLVEAGDRPDEPSTESSIRSLLG